MNKNNFTANEMLANQKMNEVRGGGFASDLYNAYTSAKGTPVTTSTSIAKPTSVRGDQRVAQITSGVSTLGTIVGATAQQINIATSMTIAALPYIK